MGRPTRAAAIDIGTNSVLLAIAEREISPNQAGSASSGLRPVVERATITRLGEGVDRTRVLAPEAVERTLSCLAEYAQVLAAHGSPPLRVVGTSAMRDAHGGEAFRARAAELLGVTPEVISGNEEAELTYRGALSGLNLNATQVVVFDVGGGSTEVICASAGGVQLTQSLDIGAVRLTERCLPSDPPTTGELEHLTQVIREELSQLPLAPAGASLVGVAGTLTSLAAIALSLEPYDAERVHGSRLDLPTVEGLFQKLAAAPLARRTQLPGLAPKRADVIVAGACIALEVMRWSGAKELAVSDRGVRWGILHALLD